MNSLTLKNEEQNGSEDVNEKRDAFDKVKKMWIALKSTEGEKKIEEFSEILGELSKAAVIDNRVGVGAAFLQLFLKAGGMALPLIKKNEFMADLQIKAAQTIEELKLIAHNNRDNAVIATAFWIQENWHKIMGVIILTYFLKKKRLLKHVKTTYETPENDAITS